MKTWIERIRQHATIHYTEDGWDILVECWPDEYIAEHYCGCATYEQAVVAISNVLAAMNEQRKDIKAEIF